MDVLETNGARPVAGGVVDGSELTVGQVYDLFEAGAFDERPEPQIMAAEADTAAEAAAPAVDPPAVRIGKWVVSTERSRAERIRDSISAFEERHAIKAAARAKASAERRRLKKKGLELPKPAADGYLPGNKPRKPNRWNRALAQAVLAVELGESEAEAA